MPIAILSCDAKPSSNLDWRETRMQALSLVASGKKILWLIDFGLFDELLKPLSDPGQFSNFALAIAHFHEKLWKEFHKFSLGVALYRGSADYSAHFSWDEGQKKNFSEWLKERFSSVEELKEESKGDFSSFEMSFPKTEEGHLILSLFMRDVSAEYLKLLASKLPSGIAPYVIFDDLPQDPLLKALLTSPESYGAIKGFESFSWRTGEKLPVAICMPADVMVKPSCLSAYRKILENMDGEDYKLIPESELVASWENLDMLYFHPPGISASGQRKIQGFLAAGGEIKVAP